MPELPEVESVRRTLHKAVSGVRVESVQIRRSDVVDGEQTPEALLAGLLIADVIRHGKQLAILGEREVDSGSNQRIVCVHLGMTGSVRVCANEAEFERGHVHIMWKLEDGRVMGFRDPRRFGGVWTFRSLADLEKTRWAALGPDALHVTAARLSLGLK